MPWGRSFGLLYNKENTSHAMVLVCVSAVGQLLVAAASA